MYPPVPLVEFSIDERFQIDDGLAIAAIRWECLYNSIAWFR